MTEQAESLAVALFLALMARNDTQAAQAAALAEQIAAGLNPAEVERAQSAALRLARGR